MTFDLALNIALGLCATFGGLFLRGMQQDITDLEIDVERIKQEYQRREDSRRDQDTIKELLRDMKKSVERIEEKLDRKADK